MERIQNPTLKTNNYFSNELRKKAFFLIITKKGNENDFHKYKWKKTNHNMLQPRPKSHILKQFFSKRDPFIRAYF